MSSNGRSYLSDQTTYPLSARISRASTRNLAPDLRTLPSSTYATASFLAISAMVICAVPCERGHSWPLFAFVLSAAVATGLGGFTAARATSGDVRKGLEEGGRGQAGSQGSQRVGRVIVAGLFGRSLKKVLEVNPGFRVDKIVTMDVALPWVEDPKAKTGQAMFFSNLIDRLKQIPGVRKVGAISGLPLVEGGLPDGMFLVMNQSEIPKTVDDFGALQQQKERLGVADFGVATDGYFQALGIPLIRGRIFDERDGPNSPHVAVISESLARDR